MKKWSKIGKSAFFKMHFFAPKIILTPKIFSPRENLEQTIDDRQKKFDPT